MSFNLHHGGRIGSQQIEDLWSVVNRSAPEEVFVIAANKGEYRDFFRQFEPAIAHAAVGEWKKSLQSGRTFRHIVLLEALAEIPAGRRPALVDQAWSHVRSKGRLTAIEVNPDRSPGRGSPEGLKLGVLKTLLRTLGTPKTLTRQPYQWTALSVRKVAETAAQTPNASISRRMAVTAELCRGRVLELGCGPGELAVEIQRRGCDVVGVDKNREKIDRARERYPSIEFHRADALDVDLPQASFDTALLPEILEHLPEATGNRIVDRAWSLLKPGGRMIVTVPNRNYVPHPNHVRIFDAESLAALLAAYGPPVLVVDQPYKWLIMYVDKAT